MEIVSNVISYIQNYFFKEELPMYTFSKNIEPTSEEIDELINATKREIKLDKELHNLNIRLKKLNEEEENEEENEKDNEEDNDNQNNGAIQERIKIDLKAYELCL